jgi:radical SAM protein with 4Fe4S-binding SPASM domain
MLEIKAENKYKPKYITAASFLVTENCNLACRYCFEKHNPDKMTPDVAKQALNFLFDNAKRGGMNEVSITLFGGEPTLVPDIIEVLFKHGLELKAKTGIKFSANMITNATIMNDRLFNLFSKYRKLVNFNVQLSIDGIKEVQDEYRVTKNGKGSFDLIEKNIPTYKKLFEDYPTGLSVHGCLNKKSLPYLYENYLFFKNTWGIDRIWFLPVCEENWDDNDVRIYKEQLQKIYDYIMTIVKKDKKLTEVYHYAPLDRCLKNGKSGKPCGAGVSYCTVTAKGELYPCHQIYYNDPERQTIMGNVWSGVDDDKRRIFMEYDRTDMSCPESCEHGYCYRCIAVNWVLYKSILTQHRGMYCEMMKVDNQLQRLMRKELEQMSLLNNKKSTGKNFKPGNNPNNPDCLCDSRGNMQCNSHTKDVTNGCDVVTGTYTSESKKYKPMSTVDVLINTFVENGRRYARYQRPDKSIYILEYKKDALNSNRSCNDNCSCGDADGKNDAGVLLQKTIALQTEVLKEILLTLAEIKKSLK